MASLIAWLLSAVVKPRSFARPLRGPKKLHVVLSESEVRNRPVFVIGDVHGCYDEMRDLMKAASQEEKDILFLFVGDLVNKGPKSKEVLQCVRQMQVDKRAYSVRGNHDEASLRQIFKMRNDKNYILGEKYAWVESIPNEEVEYLSELPYAISVPSLKVLIVHAGIIPDKPLKYQDLNLLTNMRNIVDNGDAFLGRQLVGTNSTKQGEAWAKLWPGPEHVYFGHDARRKLQLELYATGLDTGCVYGGEITGVFINGCKKRLSVKARKMYRKP